MSFFESPAYKLEIKDLLTAHEIKQGDGNWLLNLKSDSILSQTPGSSTKKLSIPTKEITLKLNMIWIQGTVLEILGEGDFPTTLHISDSTGEAFIHEYNTLPGGDHPELTKGAYVGVIGQIWSIDPLVVVKGAKLMCLHGKPLLKSLWHEEVTMTKAFLLDVIVPDLSS